MVGNPAVQFLEEYYVCGVGGGGVCRVGRGFIFFPSVYQSTMQSNRGYYSRMLGRKISEGKPFGQIVIQKKNLNLISNGSFLVFGFGA